MGWFQYDGDNGIDAFFDPVRNKSKKHFGDDSLVPFKTKLIKIDMRTLRGLLVNFRV